MEETIEQKIIRNIQGNFAVFKTPEVVGDKTLMANVEWENPEKVDKFFMFAKNLGAKVIYLTEGDEVNEETGQTKNIIMQVGFLNQGVMHHINFIEDDDEDDEEEEDDDDYEDEESQQELPPRPNPQMNQQPPSQPPQPQQGQPQGGFIQNNK